jgi:acyl carrier protein
MAESVSIPLADALGMLAECFGTDPGGLAAETERAAIPGWDSMGALMLMAELDDRFGLELTAEASRSMRKVGDVLAFLRKHRVLGDTD